MLYKTFAEIKEKIERELDLETEDFIQPEEFQEYVNDAIAVAELNIHKLGMEDEYFLTKALISLVQGQSDYDLPTDIYSNKIKRLLYVNGSTVYEIPRLRGQNRFEQRALINNSSPSTDYYGYMLRNDGPGSASQKPVIELVPSSLETVSNALELWYYRAANKWTADDTVVCDVPESALLYVYAYTRYRCYDKEGHPNTMEAKDMMMAAKQDMIETLTNMVPDEDSTIEMDVSHYADQS